MGCAVCGRYSEDSEGGFGLEVTCSLCVRKNGIGIEWEGAKSDQEQQAKKKNMASLSNSRLPAVDTGTNVVVRVPDLDRGRLVSRNILAVTKSNSQLLALLYFVFRDKILKHIHTH